jgi:hypothetical protein
MSMDEKGYIVSADGTPAWSKDKLLADNVAPDTVRGHHNIEDVPVQYLKYVWKLGEVVNGKSFITKELCDEKTEKYINATIAKLNYIDCVSGYEAALSEEGYKTISVLSSNAVFLNSSNVELLKLEKEDKTYYGLQYSTQTAIDDYVIITHILTRKPSDISHTVSVLKTIDDVRFNIGFRGNWSDYFTCWECGKKTHWLDTEQKGLLEKLSAKDEKYCGC